MLTRIKVNIYLQTFHCINMYHVIKIENIINAKLIEIFYIGIMERYSWIN